MQNLTSEHKLFIIHQLATFRTPSEVVRAVKEEFGIDITRQAVEHYDPYKAAGADLSEGSKNLFDQIRKNYLEDVSAVAISHQAFRLNKLNEMAIAALEKKNFKQAAALIEQAAKEVGGSYTNKHEISGPAGGAVKFDFTISDAPSPVSKSESEPEPDPANNQS